MTASSGVGGAPYEREELDDADQDAALVAAGQGRQEAPPEPALR